jgi:hypothetical protein
MASLHSSLPHSNILLGTDNTTACAWLNKGSMTFIAPPAFLLHQLARLHRSLHFQLTAHYVPGAANTIADCCSRFLHLSDGDFLDTMNTLFPVQPSWKLVTPPNDILSLLNYAISRRLQPLGSQQNVTIVPTLPGTCGSAFAKSSIATPTSPTWPTPSLYCKSSLIITEPVSWLPAALRSSLEQWKTPFEPWARRSLHWAAPIPAYNLPVN